MAVQPSSYQAQPAPAELTAEQKAEADAFFELLEDEAERAKYTYMQARVPAYMQPYFTEKFPRLPPAQPEATPAQP